MDEHIVLPYQKPSGNIYISKWVPDYPWSPATKQIQSQPVDRNDLFFLTPQHIQRIALKKGKSNEQAVVKGEDLKLPFSLVLGAKAGGEFIFTRRSLREQIAEQIGTLCTQKVACSSTTTGDTSSKANNVAASAMTFT